MTDMKKQKRRWPAVAGTLAALALGYAGWANRRMFTVNDVTTGESAAYPEVRPRVYYAQPDQALTTAEQSIRALPYWRVVRVDADDHALDAEVDTRVGGFTDDVTIYLMPIGGGQTRVKIRSHSRVGRGDLGQNAAHIRELQAAMDTRLTAGAAI